ncbi:MAG: hypothetical protein ACRYGF_11825 [Janthinobacterium lividum]
MSYNRSLVLLLLLVICLLAVGFPLYEKYKRQLKLKAAVLTGVFFGIVGGLLLVHAIIYWPGAQAQIYAELACLSGASIGWLLGMWLSPLGANESSKFAKYWTAIGVGSGFTIKWVMDRVADHTGWLVNHAFISTLFIVALVVTMASVYNSRAYEDSLTIAPRSPLPEYTTLKGDTVAVKAGTQATFYAAVFGPNDPLSKWGVFPDSIGQIDDLGVFKASPNAGSGRITAFNVEDPSLSGCIQVEVFVST